MPPQRSPEEIRRSIEGHRHELARSMETLRAEVEHTRDWRGHIVRNREKVLAGAAIAGFVLAGGLGGIAGIFRRS